MSPISFTAGKLAYRGRQLSHTRELIAKAVGIKKDMIPSVIDCTAGFGRDAFILASLGCNIRLIERSDTIYQLLDEAMKSYALEKPEHPLSWQLIHDDACHVLETLSPADYPDVIYLDPMFPERQKSAKVKKEAQLLQQWAKADSDDYLEKLWHLATQCARKRVVVKRPANAESLLQKKPTFSLLGKAVRFDVYQIGNK